MFAPYVWRIWTWEKYIKGTDNDTADALSRLPWIISKVKYINIKGKHYINIIREHLSGIYCVKWIYSDTFSLMHQKIDKIQRKEKVLEKNLNTQTTILNICVEVEIQLCLSVKTIKLLYHISKSKLLIGTIHNYYIQVHNIQTQLLVNASIDPT